jgi:hypothetical protein
MWPSAVQESLGPAWNYIVHGGCVKATSPPDPQPIPVPVTKDPIQIQVASTRIWEILQSLCPKHKPVKENREDFKVLTTQTQ